MFTTQAGYLMLFPSGVEYMLLQHKTRNPADPKDPGLNLLLLGAKHGHAAVVKVAIQHR